MVLSTQNAEALFHRRYIGELCGGVGKVGARIVDGKVERNRVQRGQAGALLYAIAGVDVAATRPRTRNARAEV